MKTYGLIGYPLSSSFSQKYFRNKFKQEGILQYDYALFPIASIKELPRLLETNPDCQGLNVTIPHKESVMELLDQVAETAKAVGAVNTILIKDNKLVGYNTDILGFRNSLEPLLKKHHYQGALILGSGGASKAVQFVMSQLEIPFQIVSRNAAKNVISYAELTKETLLTHPIIVNTTPLGMAPLAQEAPSIDYTVLHAEHLLYDLVYNPAKTLFLQRGEAQGAQIKNGLEMLEIQAEASWKIWTSL